MSLASEIAKLGSGLSELLIGEFQRKVNVLEVHADSQNKMLKGRQIY